jgi:hypothetical protein
VLAVEVFFDAGVDLSLVAKIQLRSRYTRTG